jgi:putative membrane protein
VKGFLIGTAATAIAIAILIYVLPQVDFTGNWVDLLIIAVIFGVVNGFIKPVVKLLALPITAITLGLFSLVINGLLLLLVAWVGDTWFNTGLTIGGFPTTGLSLDTIVAAIISSIVLSIISTLVGLVVPD